MFSKYGMDKMKMLQNLAEKRDLIYLNQSLQVSGIYSYASQQAVVEVELDTESELTLVRYWD